jgi:hypothetical protein
MAISSIVNGGSSGEASFTGATLVMGATLVGRDSVTSAGSNRWTSPVAFGGGVPGAGGTSGAV